MATILYVEDEEDDVFFMRRAFTKAKLSHALKAVADGQAAMDYLSGQGRFADRAQFPMPQLVLLDLNLPMVSGFQVLRWIRAQPGLKKLAVIVFSSSARLEDSLLANELGASDYLEKPGSGLDFQEFARCLAAKWLTPPAACEITPSPRTGTAVSTV